MGKVETASSPDSEDDRELTQIEIDFAALVLINEAKMRFERLRRRHHGETGKKHIHGLSHEPPSVLEVNLNEIREEKELIGILKQVGDDEVGDFVDTLIFFTVNVAMIQRGASVQATGPTKGRIGFVDKDGPHKITKSTVDTIQNILRTSP